MGNLRPGNPQPPDLIPGSPNREFRGLSSLSPRGFCRSLTQTVPKIGNSALQAGSIPNHGTRTPLCSIPNSSPALPAFPALPGFPFSREKRPQTRARQPPCVSSLECANSSGSSRFSLGIPEEKSQPRKRRWGSGGAAPSSWDILGF